MRHSQRGKLLRVPSPPLSGCPPPYPSSSRYHSGSPSLRPLSQGVGLQKGQGGLLWGQWRSLMGKVIFLTWPPSVEEPEAVP